MLLIHCLISLYQNKEREVKHKGDFLLKASKELDHRQVKFNEICMHYEKHDEREKKNQRNLKGLVNYAKKLTHELDLQRDKVQMAENIIADLKSAGSDNIDSLVHLLESYKTKQTQTEKEIKKVNQLIVLKDNEIIGLDEDIHDLEGYLGTAKDKLEMKIQDLLKILEENKRVIRQQDKHIVDLQQTNEISQTSIVDTNHETAKRGKEKQVLQLRLKELDGKRSSLHDSITNMETKIVSYRSVYEAKS